MLWEPPATAAAGATTTTTTRRRTSIRAARHHHMFSLKWWDYMITVLKNCEMSVTVGGKSYEKC